MSAICRVASPVTPRPAPTVTVARIAARSDAVRTSSQPPDAAERATPRIPGRRVVPVSRAARTAITTKTVAMPHCAATVPHADPAMPNPRP